MAGVLVPDHWKKRALGRVADRNPFRNISANHDLARAVRIAWVEAALEVLDAPKGQADASDWLKVRTSGLQPGVSLSVRN